MSASTTKYHHLLLKELYVGSSIHETMSKSYDIFLSHSGAQKDFVQHLNAELARVCGHYTVFFDRDAIEDGEQISTSTLEYAGTCKLAIAVVSEEYFTRSRPPMLELAASYSAAKSGKGFPSLPCLLPVFLALRPEDAKDSSTQSEWRRMWQKWEVNEKMSERRKSMPRRVQPTVWKEAVDRLLDTRGPIYIPEEYGYDPEVFMKKVAQVIARKLDNLNEGIGPSKVGNQLIRKLDDLKGGIGPSKKYRQDTITGRRPQPPPPVVTSDGLVKWEVRKILDSRRTGRWRKLHYLVEWEGYGPEQNSWEPVENLKYAPDAVKDFHRHHPDAPGPHS